MLYGATVMAQFGEYLLREFGKQGWATQAEAARKTGLSPSTLNEIIYKAKRTPSLATLRKIADAIGVSIEDLARQAGHAPTSKEAVHDRTLPESVRGLSQPSFEYLSQMSSDELERFLVLLEQNRRRAD